MGFRIEDGQGGGNQAGVLDNHRLLVSSHSQQIQQYATSKGEAFSFPSGPLFITNATENGMIYVKNTDPTRSLLVTQLQICLGKSNAPGDVGVLLYRNPTGGTLVTTGLQITPPNRNFGSSKVFNGIVMCQNGVGKTITGGQPYDYLILHDAQTFLLLPDVILPNGGTWAASITAPAGNTSMMGVTRGIGCYIDEDME